MGQGETQPADDTRDRLIETARAMVLRGDSSFSLATLCNEAQVDRSQFRVHFSGKTALMAALMQEQASRSVPVAAAPSVQPQPEPQTPKAEQESSVSTPDAWLERRLRVFERALTALELRSETTARDQARVIAQLEEKLAVLGGDQAEPRLALRPVVPAPAVAPLEEKRVSLAGEPAEQQPAPRPAMPAPVTVAQWSDAAPVAEPDAVDAACVPADEAAWLEEMKQTSAAILAVAPLPVSTISKEEMADVLQSARERARAAAAAMDEEAPKDKNQRLRWLAIGALTLVALFLCIGLTLGNTARATRDDRMAEWHGSGVSHRHVAQGALAHTIAAADYGDATAEARLALAFLRGQGVARDAGAALRWSQAAAEAGEPVAQYLLGALYQQGEAVKADPARAFAWFAAAAAKGNVKAMHNLAIAYAEGLGTAKNEAKAAEWFTRAAERGYVDSAFDLAVMYERGAGVPQDLRQALKWYGIAAHAGDQPSRARVEFLRGQMNADDARLAADAAMAFAPLPALPEANAL